MHPCIVDQQVNRPCVNGADDGEGVPCGRRRRSGVRVSATTRQTSPTFALFLSFLLSLVAEITAASQPRSATGRGGSKYAMLMIMLTARLTKFVKDCGSSRCNTWLYAHIHGIYSDLQGLLPPCFLCHCLRFFRNRLQRPFPPPPQHKAAAIRRLVVGARRGGGVVWV